MYGSLKVALARERVLQLSRVVEAAQLGHISLQQLVDVVTMLADALETARVQCIVQSKIQNEREDFFLANAQAYQRGITGLATMLQAIQRDDLELLLAGQARFEKAAADVDALIDEEAP